MILQRQNLIGRGGMAEVHLALAHGASGFSRQVAVKTLAPEHAGDPELERALIREALFAGRLHHRNLVAVLGLVVADGAYHVVMEYLDGGDLGGAGPLPPALAVHVVYEVALGLAHLHAARDERGLPLHLVHRDVGPANVLVSTTGDVKLADFGIAKATALADLTNAGVRKGTLSYMAPEQLAGAPLTQACDQYALAVTLVELVTGDRGGVDQLPPELAPIARRALATDPRDRFTSVDALRAALDPLPRAGAPALATWVLTRITS